MGIWDLPSIEDRAARPMQWGLMRPDTFKAFSYTRERLEPGVYAISLDRNDEQPIFFKKEVKADKAILRLGDLSERMVNEIEEFWQRGGLFIEHGFLHRRGYLLYGKQGVGKSTIVNQVMEDAVKRGGIVFICGAPQFFSLGLKVFRQVEPNRPIVCVFEDIDAIIKKYGEDELLSVLDGANQIDRVLNIATTNYPELLDKRIVSRPRRFDRIYKIQEPSTEVRKLYLKSKLPKGENLARWVSKTDGLSFAGLTEAIISTLCLGNDLDVTVATIRQLESQHLSSEDFGTAVGFGKEVASDDDDE